MAENSKNVGDRKENKHFFRSHNKNVIFRTCDEGTSILGERYNAENNGRIKEERETLYAVDG